MSKMELHFSTSAMTALMYGMSTESVSPQRVPVVSFCTSGTSHTPPAMGLSLAVMLYMVDSRHSRIKP
jgi:hypothetical protein